MSNFHKLGLAESRIIRMHKVKPNMKEKTGVKISNLVNISASNVQNTVVPSRHLAFIILQRYVVFKIISLKTKSSDMPSIIKQDWHSENGVRLMIRFSGRLYFYLSPAHFNVNRKSEILTSHRSSSTLLWKTPRF